MPRFLLVAPARCGGTLQQSLLCCHPYITCQGELLNSDDYDRSFTIALNNLEAIAKIDEHLKSLNSKPTIGFRICPEQLAERGMDFLEFTTKLAIDFIIVMWRQSLLDTFVSLKLAQQTNVWYLEEAPGACNSPSKTEVHLGELAAFTSKTIGEWYRIFMRWPKGISPIFVSYDELTTNLQNTMERITSHLIGCQVTSEDAKFVTAMQKQNPAAISIKVSNFDLLPPGLSEQYQLHVPALFEECQQMIRKIPPESLDLLPGAEPNAPQNSGWRYRVTEPFMPEEAKINVISALDSGFVSSAGPFASALSRKLKRLFNVPVAQPCCNGWAALVLSLQAIRVGPGDEVICPTFSMVAVSNAISLLGAIPIFVDNSSQLSFNPNSATIFPAVTSRTKAVIVCHTYGVPLEDIEVIAEECRKRSLVLIEDISECVGLEVYDRNGNLKLLGTFGELAIASMYANKIIHGGDAGFVLAKDLSLQPRLTSLVNHGFTPSYHFVHFEKAINGKINGMGAALACACVDNIGTAIRKRQQITAWYRGQLENLSEHLQQMPKCASNDTAWVFGVLCHSKQIRTNIRAFLAAHGIETRDFFFCLHRQPAFVSGEDKCPRDLINAEQLSQIGFYLPTHSNLAESDVIYICGKIKQFFTCGNNEVYLQQTALEPPPTTVLRIRNGSLNVEAWAHDQKVDRLVFLGPENCLILAVKAYYHAENYLQQERRDIGQNLIEDIRKCITNAEAASYSFVGDCLKPYLDYALSQQDFEPSPVRPWLLESIDHEFVKSVPTTTEVETRQLLTWLIKQYNCRVVLEVGAWFGHSTLLLADAIANRSSASNKTIYALDSFIWQTWMDRFISPSDRNQLQLKSSCELTEGKSFLKAFTVSTREFQNLIKPIETDVFNADLDSLLSQIDDDLDLVFLDFSRKFDELERFWDLLTQTRLVPGKTVIVINSLCSDVIKFITAHSKQLKPLAKPFSLAKAFLFVKDQDERQNERKPITPNRFFNFVESPDWSHHQQNAFCAVIEELRKTFHHPSAPILFIPAVEQYLADVWSSIDRQWVGIIHNVVDYPELMYVPDLRKLCSYPEYLPALRLCRGLFTLTELQANYLQKHLPEDVFIPICPIKYPFVPAPEHGLRWHQEPLMDLCLIGEYARDIELFVEARVPREFRKVIISGSEEVTKFVEDHNMNQTDRGDLVAVIGRLNSEEYERRLHKSVVFLPLKYDGAANTLILECISRNIPILVPLAHTTQEYLGIAYPLFYDPNLIRENGKNFVEILTEEKLQSALKYLQAMDKSKFKVEQFLTSFKTSTVLASLPPFFPPDEHHFDVTISICSFKRTHNISKILPKLWDEQTFKGNFEIVIWNNSEAREAELRKICNPYISRSSAKKSLKLISSTENYYCIIRLATVQLMQSDELLICDDDILPTPNFVDFFLNARKRFSQDVLCVRGNNFQQHTLPLHDPAPWQRYYNVVRFVDDMAPEQLIHYAHMDTCLISKAALLEASSHKLPDDGFALVDDYWISFVLSHYHDRKVRKLSYSESDRPFLRTDDSDCIGLALHTRPEVRDVRTRMYIFHMLRGWPKFETEVRKIASANLKETKLKAWGFDNAKPFVGFNVSSSLTEHDASDLRRMGVRHVRIGSVQCNEEGRFELSGFQSDFDNQMKALRSTISLLERHEISVVLTLASRIATADLWGAIAKECSDLVNLIGYDLINEPVTDEESEYHWSEIKFSAEQILEQFKQMILKIRMFDKVTPIVLEPSHWGSIHALPYFQVDDILKVDTNVIISVHFYEPQLLTFWRRNLGRYRFPGEVPIFADRNFEGNLAECNPATVAEQIKEVSNWAKKREIPLFIGECGISKRVVGADRYMDAVLGACRQEKLPAFVYAFRERMWEDMNYETSAESLLTGSFHSPAKDATYGRLRHPPILDVILQAIR